MSMRGVRLDVMEQALKRACLEEETATRFREGGFWSDARHWQTRAYKSFAIALKAERQALQHSA